ncbi:DUF6615 family protein [Nocardia asiatica]|uniref:DUF6615 family protein n=1 Tax=Nocardia asiatica TaxID=209252 RepID=UPI003EE33FB2
MSTSGRPRVKDWELWVRRNVGAPRVALQLGRRARWAGKRIAQGERFGVRQDEESLTSALLLDLMLGLPDLRVRTLSRAEETVEGADWQWWIEGATTWFGALIQAKRLSPNQTYGFDYRPKPSIRNPAPEMQIDSLIAKARSLKIPPLYVLYNDTSDPLGKLSSRRCRQHRLLPAGGAGITVLHATTAKWLLSLNGNKPVSVSDVAQYAVPWSCLAGCGRRCSFGRYLGAAESGGRGDGDSSDNDLSDEAAALVSRLITASRIQQFSRQAEPRYSLAIGVRDEPPWYVPRRDDPPDRDIDWDLPLDWISSYVVALYRGRGGYG